MAHIVYLDTRTGQLPVYFPPPEDGAAEERDEGRPFYVAPLGPDGAGSAPMIQPGYITVDAADPAAEVPGTHDPV